LNPLSGALTYAGSRPSRNWPYVFALFKTPHQLWEVVLRTALVGRCAIVLIPTVGANDARWDSGFFFGAVGYAALPPI